MPFEDFCAAAEPWLDKNPNLKQYDYKKLAALIQTRIEIFSEIPEKLAFLPEVAPHEPALYCHKKFKLDEAGARESLQQVKEAYEGIELWCEQSIHDTLIRLAQENVAGARCFVRTGKYARRGSGTGRYFGKGRNAAAAG